MSTSLKILLTISLLSLNSCVGEVTNNIDAKIDSKVNASADIKANANVNTNIDAKVKTGNIASNNSAQNKTIKQIMSISTSLSEISLNIGDTSEISANVKFTDNSTNNNLSWVSSNSSIAKVDSNGKVTGVSEGNTTIIVSAKEDVSKSSVINVKVLNKTTSPVIDPSPTPTTTPVSSNIPTSPTPISSYTPVPTPTVLPSKIDEIILGSSTKNAVKIDSNGNYIIAYLKQYSDSTGKPQYDLYFSKYSSTGKVINSDIKINAPSDSYKGQINISINPSGNFMICWYNGKGSDGQGEGIYSQYYDSNASAISNVLKTANTSSNFYSRSFFTEVIKVIADESGNYNILWNDTGIFSKKYNYKGDIIASEKKLQDVSSLDLIQSNNKYLNLDSSSEIIGYSYSLDGIKDKTFQVNTYVNDIQGNQKIKPFNNGFITTWQSQYQDGNYNGIYAQMFDSNYNKIGGEFLVNTTTQGDQITPNIAVDKDGSFIISWLGDGKDIYAQRFNSSGVKLNSEFLVFSLTTSPLVLNRYKIILTEIDNNGNYVIVYTLSSIIETYSIGKIYAKRVDKNNNLIQ